MRTTEPPSPDRTTQRAALVVASVTSFLAPFMGSSVNVALPSIGRDFSLGAVTIGWVNMAFLLAAAAFSISFGRFGDLYGRKKVFVTGIVVFTAASVLIAVSPSGAVLITGRAIQGIGSSMIFSVGMAILISVYPPSERGRVLGINVAAVYFGLSSGPFAGGLVTEYLGWRALFWLNLPIGLLLLWMSITMLKVEWSEEKKAAFDWIGSGILAAALSLSIFAFSRLPETTAFLLLGAGLAGLVGFVLFETRQKAPLLDVGLFHRNRVFAFSSLAALINYAATFAVGFLLSLYLQKARGLSPKEAGIILVCQPLVQALLSPLAGRLSDRIDPRTVASSGMALCFVGLVLLNFIDAKTSLYFLVACLIFLGLGFAFFSSPNTKAIMSAVDRNTFGVASAVVGTMRQVGMTFSMGVVMMILAVHIGQAQVSPENAEAFISGMHTAFTVFAALCFLGIFASLARGKGNG